MYLKKIGEALKQEIFKKKYETLIAPTRRKKSELHERSIDLQFLSDKSRVVASSAFRRLQAKAQVFSLEENAAVRTRLTHSIEVSLVGQLIAYRVFQRLVEKGHIAPTLLIPFTSSVETACLLHDIGNPPFGHFGESAIRDWVSQKFKSEKDQTLLPFIDSLARFDGNAQGFRIITRLQRHKSDYGLNLTCTQIASTIKYPTGDKKISYFKADENIYADICQNLDLPTAGRHPLSLLMEAADDIAYCMSDIEDGIEKKIVTGESALDCIKEAISTIKNRDAANVILDTLTKIEKDQECDTGIKKFIEFKISITQKLVEWAVDSYINSEVAILDGTFEHGLLKEGTAFEVLFAIKSFAKKKLFNSCHAYDIELSGHSIVVGILDSFNRIIDLNESSFAALLEDTGPHSLALEQRLIWLLPKKHIEVYKACVKNGSLPEMVARTHLIVDYVSGMTDPHALKVYQILKGIKVGVRT
ncbi:dGTP triphosphohydrolase [Bdellovibrio sp. HCB2-146]|uniref:dGTP triphosphohydrolase n=1 Tax=Bdellovibrio sp. HCB2-146 TaxID=3394362 RepID=UPI0039BD4454